MDSTQTRLPLIKRILYFFPVQLLLLHFKRNHLVLIFWAVLFGYTTGLIGEKYGIPYLFLAPEYLGHINAISFGIFGFALGGFIMSFNIYSYISHAHRFGFIATVARPFYKFSLNNSLIPIFFTIVFIVQSVHFQRVNELLPTSDIVLNIMSFLMGCFLFFLLSFMYFFRTNKDMHKLGGHDENKPFTSTLHNNSKWYEAFFHDQEWKVHSYISGLTHINIARDSKHYDVGLMKQVLSQNSINATIFEIITLVSFVVLGTFKEFDWIRIPAGASILLLFTISLMIISILQSWLKGWTFAVVVSAVVLINWGTNQSDFLRFKSYAYGLDYETSSAQYNRSVLHAFHSDTSLIQKDLAHGQRILNNWKSHQNEALPKMYIINCSGGGLRSAIWTFQVMQELDKQSNGEFLQHTALITGSSGGMIGAAYYRELALLDKENNTNSRFESYYRERLSQDLLNSVAFSIATSDLFPRIQSFNDGEHSYTKDRGYMFEKNLNENTNFVLDKRLKDYYEPEFSADIPMLILAPTIINDGRRLLISPQPLSYMMAGSNSSENVEFLRLFQEQDASNLRFTSALRMNATFPYVLPMVTLPSEPTVEIMDAGLRDNYGIKDAIKFLSSHQAWIKENTSEVVLVQIRDRAKNSKNEKQSATSLLSKILAPFGNVYSNVLKSQDYSNDQLMQEFQMHFDHRLEIQSFNLINDDKVKISLSWHMTALEKKLIKDALERNKSSVVKSLSYFDSFK